MLGAKEMDYLFANRRSGKTMESIKRSNETGARIVCQSQPQVRMIMETARRMGVDIPEPIITSRVREEAVRGRLVGRNGMYIVDNLTNFIEDMLGGEVILATDTPNTNATITLQ